MVEELMSHVDVLPTMLDFVGADVPGNMQGHSLMPFVSGRADTAPRTAAFAQYTPDMNNCIQFVTSIFSCQTGL